MAKLAASPPPAAPAARAPRQDRGLQRVELILDAAEALIAEFGVEATSTNAIAERAKTSMGSLYHFFPSKEALIEALARRFAERKRELNAKAVPVDRARMPLEEVVERVVDGHARFLAESPAFVPIYDAVTQGRAAACMNEELVDAIVAQVRDFLAARLPAMREQDRNTSALLSVTTVHGVLLTAMRLSPKASGPLLRELKRMLVAYFAPLDVSYGATRERVGARRREA
jgi:AcrR family transcriptional regulator